MANKILYKAYLSEEEEKKEEQEKEQKNREREIRQLRENIFLFSLEHGCGVTHLAATLANYIASTRKGSTVLITDSHDVASELIIPKVLCFSPHQAENMGVEYSNVVWDGGVFSEFDTNDMNAMARSSKKAIVCQTDVTYMERLATFTAERKNGLDYAYLFNILPKERIKRVENAMSSYDQVFCFPLFLPSSIPDSVSKDLFQLLNGGH